MAGVAAMVFLPCSLLHHHHHHLLLDSRPTPPLLTHTMGSGLWPADRAASQTASSHQPLVCGGASATGGPPAARDPFARPGGGLKYPYSSSEVDLPPTIALSDGEEPPPYKGPCSLRLRNHEQQLEINREAIRPPPNRTVFDSDYWPHFRPPSCRAGVSAGGARGGDGGGGPPAGAVAAAAALLQRGAETLPHAARRYRDRRRRRQGGSGPRRGHGRRCRRRRRLRDQRGCRHEARRGRRRRQQRRRDRARDGGRGGGGRGGGGGRPTAD
ncbi:uncharacterized protein LOC144949646 [Lampetra fluviatilis]